MNLARLATQPGYHVGPTSVMQPDDIQVPLDHAKPSGPWDAWLKRTCAFWKQTATNNRSEIQSKFFCSKCRSLTVLMSTRGLLPTTLAFPTQIGTLLHLSQTFPTKKSLRFIAMTPPASRSPTHQLLSTKNKHTVTRCSTRTMTSAVRSHQPSLSTPKQQRLAPRAVGRRYFCRLPSSFPFLPIIIVNAQLPCLRKGAPVSDMQIG